MTGTTAPPTVKKHVHLPQVKRYESHVYKGACMKAQHNTLPDGTGAGQGWIMTKQMEKGRFVLDMQAAWKAQQPRGQHTWQPQKQQRQTHLYPKQQWHQQRQQQQNPQPPQQQYHQQQQAHNVYQMVPPQLQQQQYQPPQGTYMQQQQKPPNGYQQQ